MNGKGTTKYVSIQDKLKALKIIDQGETFKNLQLTTVQAKQQKAIGAVTEIKLNSVLLLKVLIATYTRNSMKKNLIMTCLVKPYFIALVNSVKRKSHFRSHLPGKGFVFRNQLEEGEKQFAASTGWLDRWNNLYGSRQFEICREELSADSYEMSPSRCYSCRGGVHQTGLRIGFLQLT